MIIGIVILSISVLVISWPIIGCIRMDKLAKREAEIDEELERRERDGDKYWWITDSIHYNLVMTGFCWKLWRKIPPISEHPAISRYKIPDDVFNEYFDDYWKGLVIANKIAKGGKIDKDKEREHLKQKIENNIKKPLWVIECDKKWEKIRAERVIC